MGQGNNIGYALRDAPSAFLRSRIKWKRMMTLLEVKNLQVRVEDREILHGLALTVNKGQAHAIMGPHGSAKAPLSQCTARQPGRGGAGRQSRMRGGGPGGGGPRGGRRQGCFPGPSVPGGNSRGRSHE